MPIPAAHTAGTTLAATATFPAYDAAEWTATLMLRGPTAIDIAGVADGRNFAFRADDSTTATWEPGRYWWVIRLTDGDTVLDESEGHIDVRPDMAALGSHDGRTYAARMLDAVNAVLEKRATLEQASYTIGDRTLERRSIPELMRLRSVFAAEVRAETTARHPMGRIIPVRLP